MRCQIIHNYKGIIAELSKQEKHIDLKATLELKKLIIQANKIFCDGKGRSGLMIKAFANRLLHLGFNCNAIGEITTPPVKKNDLLISVSGSGETRSVIYNIQKANDFGASTVLLTTNLSSKASQIAKLRLLIPGNTKENSVLKSIQPLGALFEQTTLLYFDALVLQLMKDKGLNNDAVAMGHANIE